MLGLFNILSVFILTSAYKDNFSIKSTNSARESLLSLSKYDRLFQQESAVFHADLGKTYSAVVNSSVEIIFEIAYQEVINQVCKLISFKRHQYDLGPNTHPLLFSVFIN